MTPFPVTRSSLRRKIIRDLTGQTGVKIARASWARTFGRAQELCRDVDDVPFLSRALAGLIFFYFSRAELDTAAELAQEIVVLGERTREGSIEMTGHALLGLPLLHQGHFADALEHFDRALSLYDPSWFRSLALTYGQDMGSTAYAYSA